MIKSWKHKGLERFFKTGNSSGIASEHVNKLRTRLALLNAATGPKDMNLPIVNYEDYH